MSSWWASPVVQQDRRAFEAAIQVELPRMSVGIKDKGLPIKDFGGVNRGWGWPDRMKKEEGE